MDLTIATSLIINGFIIASIYAVSAWGLAIIYGVMKIINLAHPAMVMMGAYGAYWLYTLFGIDPTLSAFLLSPIFFGAGYLIEKYLVRAAGKDNNHFALPVLLLLFGFWMVMQNIAYILWTGNERAIITNYTYSTIKILGISLSYTRVIAFAFSISIFIFLYLLFSKTNIGRSIQATSQNREGAALSGINVSRITSITFGLGTALAGFSGCIMSLIYMITPSFGGGAMLIKSFLVIIVGGMENVLGIGIGALFLASTESASTFVFQTALVDAISFILLIIVLLFLPQGIGGYFASHKKVVK